MKARTKRNGAVGKKANGNGGASVIHLAADDAAVLRDADAALARLKIAYADNELNILRAQQQRQAILEAIDGAQQHLNEKGKAAVEKLSLPKDQRWNLDLTTMQLTKL